MESLQCLRKCICDLKAAPIFTKAAHAEKTIDALILVIDQQQHDINLLKKELNHGNEKNSSN